MKNRNIYFIGFVFMVMALIGFSSGANAADMAPEYLHGNWVIGTTEQKCGDAEAEYFEFKENGTFEAGSGSKTVDRRQTQTIG